MPPQLAVHPDRRGSGTLDLLLLSALSRPPYSSAGVSVVLPDYDALPLIEEGVAPHHVVDPILGKREDEIHDREREEHVSVDEHSGHEQ
jgi:hypothetical protein